MKERNIALCIVFSFITCGIYGLYWFFVTLTDDLKQAAGDEKTAGGVLALILTLVTCNIYGWYWSYKRGENIDTAKTQSGAVSNNSGILFIILQALGLGIIAYAIMQNEINNMIENNSSAM